MPPVDATQSLLRASRLSEEQVKYMTLVWIEVRRFFALLADLPPDMLGFGLPKKKEKLDYGQLHTIEEKLWIAYTSPLHNIWHSRLWEQEFGPLRHSYPLRQVHKWYMLQFEESAKKEIILKGNKSKKSLSAKPLKYQQYMMQNLGPTLPGERLSLRIQLQPTRYPRQSSLTVNHFWGMLQIFWLHNLEELLGLYPNKLVQNNVDLRNTVGRIRQYIDSYYKASGFVPPSELEKSNIPAATGSNSGGKLAMSKEELRPVDQLKAWKDFLKDAGGCLPGFDLTFVRYLMARHAKSYPDDCYVTAIYAKAQYLTRFWDRYTRDEQLKTAIMKLTGSEFFPNIGPMVPDGIRIGNSVTSQEIILEALVQFDNQARDVLASATKAATVLENVAKVPGASTVEVQQKARITYTKLSSIFVTLDQMRSGVARFIDAMDEKCVVDECNFYYRNLKRPLDLKLEDWYIMAFWKFVAEQYGFISFNDGWLDCLTRVGSAQLLELPLDRRNTREKENRYLRAHHVNIKHHPQRARRQMKRFRRKGSINYKDSENPSKWLPAGFWQEYDSDYDMSESEKSVHSPVRRAYGEEEEEEAEEL